jgi:MFS family permease
VLKSNLFFLLFVICGAALCEIEHTISVFFASPAYQEAGIPLNWYGVLNLSLNLTGAIGGLLSARLAKRGNGRVVAVCWLLALASSAALSLTRSAGALILLLPMLRFAVQAYFPFEQLLKTQRTGGASRAVVLSAYNMVAGVVGIALGPILGAGTGIDLEHGFIIGFAIMLLAAIAALLLWRKMRNQLKIDSPESS